jgi:hypothetical protein
LNFFRLSDPRAADAAAHPTTRERECDGREPTGVTEQRIGDV